MYWTELYRPRHIADAVGQDSIKRFLTRLTVEPVKSKIPHLILYGPSGTGKTTLALSFATDLYPGVPLILSTLYLNASDERIVETIRDRVREFLRISWIDSSFRKIVILDEIETMTDPAQQTLRSLLDSPVITDTHLPLFIILCNSISRIIPSIRSSALAIFCGHLAVPHIRELLTTIQSQQDQQDKDKDHQDKDHKGKDHKGKDHKGKDQIILPTPLACLLNRGDVRSFLQKAQQGENPNVWTSWIQRLFNTPADRVHIVWEEGFSRIPAWLLFRHVLVFCYAMGIPMSEQWLQVVLRNREVVNIVEVSTAWSVEVINKIKR